MFEPPNATPTVDRPHAPRIPAPESHDHPLRPRSASVRDIHVAMTEEQPNEPSIQDVLDVLADPDCREIVGDLEEPRGAQAVADRCDLSQTSAYRKLEALCEAGLLTEGTEMRADGHHVTTYERDVGGVFVALDGEDAFDFEFVRESTAPDRRLAQFWSRISEEL